MHVSMLFLEEVRRRRQVLKGVQDTKHFKNPLLYYYKLIRIGHFGPNLLVKHSYCFYGRVFVFVARQP